MLNVAFNWLATHPGKVKILLVASRYIKLYLPALALFWYSLDMHFFVMITIFSLFATEGKHGGGESKKAPSDCDENDSCHGDHMDSGICIGFLSHSLFGISIRYHQQFSR